MVGLATTILLVFPLCVTLFFTFLHFSPFCTYIVHPPQQKVTPRRGGETRQMAFRTRQECEGQTIAWQSKKTALLITKAYT